MFSLPHHWFGGELSKNILSVTENNYNNSVTQLAVRGPRIVHVTSYRLTFYYLTAFSFLLATK
jgi:hypothetical protein